MESRSGAHVQRGEKVTHNEPCMYSCPSDASVTLSSVTLDKCLNTQTNQSSV